jgi:hypothetical protein
MRVDKDYERQTLLYSEHRSMDKLLVVTTLVNGRRPSDTFEVRARGSMDKKWEAGKHRKRLFFDFFLVMFRRSLCEFSWGRAVDICVAQLLCRYSYPVTRPKAFAWLLSVADRHRWHR